MFSKIEDFISWDFGDWKKEVPDKQDWKGEEVDWDPDSSPEAWEHYKKYYTPECWKLLERYGDKDFADREHLFFYRGGEYCLGPGRGKKAKALVAPQIKVGCSECGTCKDRKEKGKNPRLRIRGETDFNFKKDKYDIFKNILENTPPKSCSPQNALDLLEKCKEMHHSLLNFSLLQSVGNMQGFKGRGLENEGLDRPDTFIYYLDRYFEGKDKRILEKSRKNKDCLIQYLASFTDIYDYCEKVYFIKDDDFVQEMIESGGKKLLSGDDVVKYMKLAVGFWDRKQKYFKKA